MISPSSFLISLYLVSNLSCPPTVVENRTNTWKKIDHDNLMMARKRCPELYKDSPCLKFFRKKEELVYHAVCGEESK